MNLNENIFRMYDIRGKSGKEISEDLSYTLGNEFTKLIPTSLPKRIVVGRDCRLTSKAYADALILGLSDGGIDVLDIGMVPTPLVYFSLFQRKVGGGIMITASHNPPEDNGFKLSIGPDSMYGEDILTLFRMIKAPTRVCKSSKGLIENEDVSSDYISFFKKNISIDKKISITIDAGNGATSNIAPKLFKEIGLSPVTLFCTPDGNFPNHHPDPTNASTLTSLIDCVKSNSSDIGFSFDGDGDRIGVVDKAGRIYGGDELLILFVRDILKTRSGATIISEVKASDRLFSEIIKLGGNPLMWKTGHSLIKSKMRETGALLAGELSGHIFFADRYFGYDDALYAAARLSELISNSNLSISEHLSELSTTFTTPEIRIGCEDKFKFSIVKKVTEHFTKLYPTNDIDGVRISFTDGWGLVRASNTEPSLVLRFEATTKERLEEIKQEVEEVVVDASRR